MKNRMFLGGFAAALVAAGVTHAQTDGAATFRVTTVTAGGAYAPSHVLAIWVTDAQTNFVKTLKRQAATRIQYLRQWGTASRSNVVDAITGATLNSHQTHTLTWNCRNTNGVLVADGVYRFFVEFSEYNGQGPWTSTNILSFYKGAAGVTSYPPDQANFASMMVQYIPAGGGSAGLPGTLQAEDYNAFYDSTAGNQGGQYRTDDVDIEVCAEGGYDVGWIVAAEWLEFNTAVATTGVYDLRFRVSSASTASKSLHVEVDGTNVTGAVGFNTGGAGWQAWTNAWASNVTLYAGARRVRVVMDTGDFNLNYVAATPAPFHDVAVAGITVPGFVPAGTTTGVVVAVTNRGGYAESVTVRLSNTTDHVLIGAQTASGLPAGARTNVTFSWNTATASTGIHSLVASAGPVAGETSLADNTVTTTVLVALGVVTNTLVARGSSWRYSDEGLDLSGTPWRQAAYYDGHWAAGPGVLGFGNGGEATVLATAASVTNPFGLLNAGFELEGAGGADKATNWNGETESGLVVGGSWGGASRESWRAHGGAWEASVHDWGASGWGAGFWQQVTNNLGAGSLWTASIWAWNDNGQSGIYFTNASRTYYLKIEWYGHTNQFLSQDVANVPLPGEVWTKGLLQAVAPAGAAWARFVVGAEGMSAGGALQFDDAAIVGLRPGRTTWYLRRDAYLDAMPMSVSAGVRRDDGVALYVNGAEALREGLPAGSLAADTPATNAVFGAAETAYVARALSPSLFAPGRNVIAAEVHQAHGPHPEVSTVWINELHYDNSGTDTNEGIEVAGAAGTDLAAYQLVFYNGGSDIYRTNLLSGVIPNEANGCGARWFAISGLQNGGPDGVALVRGGTSAVQLLSYEGTFTATIGAAAGLTSTDLGVAEPGAVGQSLLLVGTGVGYSAFAWIGPVSASTGRLSSGQAILPAESADIAFDLELTAVTPVANPVRSVGVSGMDGPGAVIAGDRAAFVVTVSNSGDAVETFLVVLVDTNTDQVVGSRTVSNLVAGAMIDVRFEWNTYGLAEGLHGLRAYTVRSGVTNLAASATAPFAVEGSGFGLNAVAATGSVGGRCSAVAAAGSLLVVGAGASLETWDRSAPLAPVRSGSVRLPGLIEAIVVNGSYAYAACGPAGVQIVDLATPSQPIHAGTFDSSGHAHSLAWSGGYLYVADGVAGLRILDVADPLSPSLAGTWHTVGPARAVAVSGSRAYLLDEFDGLVILDVSGPSAPALLGRYAPLGAARGLALNGSYALVADDNGVFSVVNVAAPESPALAGSIRLGAFGESLSATGSAAYVAAGGAGLLTVSIASPSAPAVVFTNAETAADVSVAGSAGYVAAGHAGVRALSLASPLAPSVAGTYPAGHRASDIAVAGQLAYVAAGERGLCVVSVSNPASPVLLGSCAVGNARSVALRGALAVVGDGTYGLRLVDVSSPSSPAVVGSFSSSNLVFARSVAAAGSYAAATDGRRIVLVNIATPASPVLQAVTTSDGFVFDLAMTTTHVFAAEGGDGLAILSIPMLLAAGGYDTPGMAVAVELDGARAHVADGAGGWLVFDVATPMSPVLLGSSQGQGAVDSLGLVAYVTAYAGPSNVVSALDVSDPLTPVSKASFDRLVRVLRLASTGPYVLTAEDDAGVAIFDVLPDDHDTDRMSDAWERGIVDDDPDDDITTVADVLPGDDFDGDKLSNLEEFIAGTQSTNAASVFAFSAPNALPGDRHVVRWSSVAGKSYNLYRSTNLVQGFTLLTGGIPATEPINSYTDTVGAASAYFYMVGVR